MGEILESAELLAPVPSQMERMLYSRFVAALSQPRPAKTDRLLSRSKSASTHRAVHATDPGDWLSRTGLSGTET